MSIREVVRDELYDTLVGVYGYPEEIDVYQYEGLVDTIIENMWTEFDTTVSIYVSDYKEDELADED